MFARKEKLRSYVFDRCSFGGSGLRLCSINKMADTTDNKGLRLSFSTGVTDQTSLWVECEEAHPFFVKDKGMNSYTAFPEIGERTRKY